MNLHKRDLIHKYQDFSHWIFLTKYVFLMRELIHADGEDSTVEHNHFEGSGACAVLAKLCAKMDCPVALSITECSKSCNWVAWSQNITLLFLPERIWGIFTNFLVLNTFLGFITAVRRPRFPPAFLNRLLFATLMPFPGNLHRKSGILCRVCKGSHQPPTCSREMIIKHLRNFS